MFFTLEDHFKYVDSEIDKQPISVNIATFGVYCGVLHTGYDLHKSGGKYTSRTRTALDKMLSAGAKVRILTGITEYKSCKGVEKCLHCESLYIKSLFRLLEHATFFPSIKWRVNFHLHTKYTIFQHRDSISGILGGRNFTDSDWEDVTVVAQPSDIPRLVVHFKGLWDGALELNSQFVSDVLEKYKIDPQAIDLL